MGGEACMKVLSQEEISRILSSVRNLKHIVCLRTRVEKVEK
jgi:hypothetical protein